ncbi:alpha-N-acetylgalactosamine-specific lectin-like [Diadema antillarum]|uniref:alpha-N-acetylgalactosamine-specific lectin-like n=1 Tax=Diadema antillarum TaxID=105358 RepID=UPI003A8AD424
MSASACQTCPALWLEYDGSCYRYFGERVIQSEAEGLCNTFETNSGQGSLVSISNARENDFVYDIFRSVVGDVENHMSGDDPVYGYWIGLYRQDNGAPWLWTDGTTSDYRNWRAGEPNDSNGNEDCANVWRVEDKNDNFKDWNDIACNTPFKIQYICGLERMA